MAKKNKTQIAHVTDQISEKEIIPGLTVLTIKTNVERVVRISGSLLGGDSMVLDQNPSLLAICARMFDQGTKKKSKEKLHEIMDSRAISIDFDVGTTRTSFNISCLREDVELAISLCAEMLKEPSFPSEELQMTKKRLLGNIEESKTDTNFLARCELARALFPKGHPHRYFTPDEEIAQIEAITQADLMLGHQKYGLGKMYVVAGGDINQQEIETLFTKNFSTWKTTGFEEKTFGPGIIPSGKKTVIHVSNKTSADAIIGIALPITISHPDFYPLMLGNVILGGGFNARLTQEIREKRGLTYGTYSYMRGVGVTIPGYWSAWGTFAPELAQQGIDAMQKEIKKFSTRGVTAIELKNKKMAIAGSYSVELATTGGIVSVLLSNKINGFDKNFIDNYPAIIEKLTLEKVNGSIKKYFSNKKLVTVVAGSI